MALLACDPSCVQPSAADRHASERPIPALLLVLLASALVRLAYAAAWSELIMGYYRRTANTGDLGTLMTMTTWGGAAASFLGAALAYRIGPRITATMGAALLVVAVAALAFDSRYLAFPLGAALLALAVGVFEVCPYVAAAELVGWTGRPGAPSVRRFSNVAAFALALVAAHAGARLVARGVGAFAIDGAPGSGTSVYVLCLPFAIAATLSAAGSVYVGRPRLLLGGEAMPPLDVYRRAAPPEPPVAERPAVPSDGIAGARLLALPTALFAAGFGTIWTSWTPAISAGTRTILQVAGTSFTLLAGGVGAVVIALSPPRSPSTLLKACAGGLLALAVAAALRAVGGDDSALVHLAVYVALALAAAGSAIGTAYISIAARGRVVGFLVALSLALADLASGVASTLRSFAGASVGLGIFALFAVGTAAWLFAHAAHVQQRFDPSPRPRPD